MKKLLLLGLMCCFLVCFLAISVSAVTGSDSDAFGEVTYVDGVNASTTIQDKTSRVVLKNADGTFTTYPAYYISDVKLQWQGTVQYKFDALNTALGTSYDMDSIIRVEVLTDSTVINQNGGSYQNRKNLKEVVFPIGTQIKEFGGQQFKGSAIETFCIPATITKIGVNLFEGCQSLKEVTFEEGFNMTTVPTQIFNGCTSLERVVFPDCFSGSTASIFSGCSSLKEVRFGKDFATYPTGNGLGISNTVVIYAYSNFLSNITNISRTTFSGYQDNYAKTATLFLVGTKADAEALVAKASLDTLKNAKLVEWDPSKPDSYYIPENPTTWTIIYSYSMCAHDWSETNQVKVESYLSEIQVGKVCSKCQMVETVNTISPIFTCLGYSTTQSPDKNGKYSITVGYRINTESFEKYLGYASLKYGTVVSAVNVSDPLAVENGNVTVKKGAKALMSFQKEPVCNFVDIKLKGAASSVNGNELMMSIFVFDGKTVFYLNEAFVINIG